MKREAALAIFRASPIYALTAEKMSCGRSALQTAEAMLAGGVRLLQYREKEKTGRARYEDCLALRQLCNRYRAVFIVDDFVDLAMAVGADGVHIGQDDLPPAVVRQLVGGDMLVGLSTHNPAQLEASNALGDTIDYIGCGPVYPTQTKDKPAPVTGLAYIQYAAQHATHPFTAIGGIKRHNLQDVRRAGATTCALVSEITGAPDIAQRVQELLALSAGA
ncbi:MAG: thiamine phosphate synthase [Selenomonadaceae bacterium]|nr:thiamine phosphate synthase [Selenomonadaceae bacterium]